MKLEIDTYMHWLCDSCGRMYRYERYGPKPVCPCEKGAVRITVKDESSPPALGVSVSDGINAGEKLGG